VFIKLHLIIPAYFYGLLYAVIDIEATGSKYPADRIMELAIVKHDGRQILSTWSSLLKPGVPIPPFVVELTGITEEMVEEAPHFHEKAHEIWREIAGCVIVGHDVNFDYNFLKHELMEVGYELEAPRLCTLKKSRKFIPEQPSYSLGRLAEGLGITIENRHRALGDALATAAIFELLFPHLEGWVAHVKAHNEVPLEDVVRIKKSK